MKKPHHIGRVYVRGHFRQGTYVHAYTRSFPVRRPTYPMVAKMPVKQPDQLFELYGLLPLIVTLFVYRDAWWPWIVTAYQWVVQANLPWWLYVVGYVCLALLLRQIWWWLVAAATLALLVSAACWLLL